MIVFMFLLLFGFLPLSGEDCTTTKEFIFCKNATVFPNGNKSTRVLKITDSSLYTIPENTFVKNELISLRAVVLRRSNIKNISKDSFGGLSNLRLLDLAGNHLKEFRMNLKAVSRLKILCLAGNKLHHVDSNTFLHLNELLVLDLAGNGIKKIDGNFLEPLREIEYLDLSRNHLTTIGQLFSNSLRFLRIPSLKLTTNFTNLQVIDVNSSMFENLPHIFHLVINLHVVYKNIDLINNDIQTSRNNVVVSYDLFKVPEHLQFKSMIKRNVFRDYLDLELHNITVHNQRDSTTAIQRVMLFVLLVYLSVVYILLFRKTVQCCTKFRILNPRKYERI